MEKSRLDNLLVERGLAPTRARAKAAIMAGLVLVNGKKVDKAGTEVPLEADIKLAGPDLPYVSRGGLKLARAIEFFGLDLHGRVVLDAGASTGGFTDCALQNGAVKVYAVDVGYGQLAWSLRQDPRVVVMERTNIRYLTPQELLGLSGVTPLPEPRDLPGFATADLSFISLTKVLPQLKLLTSLRAEFVVLIKPQFEAGRDKVGKKGVVKDPDVHREVLEQVMEAARENGFMVKGLTYSPVKGPEGNIEYLLYLGKFAGAESERNSGIAYERKSEIDSEHSADVSVDAGEVVGAAFSNLI